MSQKCIILTGLELDKLFLQRLLCNNEDVMHEIDFSLRNRKIRWGLFPEELKRKLDRMQDLKYGHVSMQIDFKVQWPAAGTLTGNILTTIFLTHASEHMRCQCKAKHLDKILVL